MKVYTKLGDDGKTFTYGNLRVPKDSYIVDINGSIDFLQSSLDFCWFYNEEFREIIEFINKKLWQLGGEISLGGIGGHIKDPIKEEDILFLEKTIDKFSAPNNFVRFTKRGSVNLNEARVRCRILERDLTPLLREGMIREEVYRFMNRLSDLLFILAYKVETEEKN